MFSIARVFSRSWSLLYIQLFRFDRVFSSSCSLLMYKNDHVWPSILPVLESIGIKMFRIDRVFSIGPGVYCIKLFRFDRVFSRSCSLLSSQGLDMIICMITLLQASGFNAKYVHKSFFTNIWKTNNIYEILHFLHFLQKKKKCVKTGYFKELEKIVTRW